MTEMEKILYNLIRVNVEFPIHYEASDYHEFSYLRDFLRHAINRDDIEFQETVFNEDTRKYEAIFYLKEQSKGADELVKDIQEKAEEIL